MIGWFSDIHLKSTNIELVDFIILQIIKICNERDIKFLFNGGDNFDSRVGQPLDVLKAFHRYLKLFEGQGITMFAFPGNHDKTNYESDDSFLIPFQEHKAFRLIEEYNDDFLSVGVLYHMIPYYSPDVYKKKLAKVKFNLKVKNVLLTHVDIKGAIANSGKVLDYGISPSLLKKFDEVYVAHFHNKHFIGKNIHYLGSTHATNFGETNDKGMWVFDDKGKAEFIPLVYPKYITVVSDKIDDSYKQELINFQKESDDFYRLKVKSIDPKEKLELESVGIKVVVEREDIIIQTKKTVQVFDDKEIISSFNEWAKKRKPSDLKFGKDLLTQEINKGVASN